MRKLGQTLEVATYADSAVEVLESEYEWIRQTVDGAEPRPTVVFLIGSDPLFAFGRGSYVHDMIGTAGGRSLTADLATPAPVLNEEFVLTAMPDVIIGTLGEGAAETLAARYPSWTLTPALRNGRVYSFEPSLFLRSGPRLVEGTRRLAERLHPERFFAAAGAGS
jgi:iron complex transport system substrate-binding protein